MYPTALRATSATALGVECCVVNEHVVRCKTHQEGAQKLLKNDQKSIKNQSKFDQKSIKNRSWGLLGGSWGRLNPKMAPRTKKTPKSKSFAPLLGPILRSKIDQNRSQERSRRV